MRRLATLLSVFMLLNHGHTQEVFLTVYPGDTNNDSTVQVRDILPVGIAFQRETFPREIPNTDWQPQDAVGLELNTLPLSGINIAHVDADGNGLVDTNDYRFVAVHYDSLVVDDAPPLYAPPLPTEVPYCPFLRITFNQDTVRVLDTVIAEVFIEGLPFTGVPEPLGILGVTFSLDFDIMNVKDSLLEVYPDTLAGDLMFIDATFFKADSARAIPRGRVDFGAAAYGLNAIQQPRRIAEISIIIEDMVFRNDIAVPFVLTVEEASVLFVNREEFFIPACPSEIDTVILLDMTNQVAEVDPQPWVLAPNPSASTFYLSGDEPIERVSVFDIQGRLCQQYVAPAFGQALSPKGLAPGLYLVRIEGKSVAQMLKWQKILN